MIYRCLFPPGTVVHLSFEDRVVLHAVDGVLMLRKIRNRCLPPSKLIHISPIALVAFPTKRSRQRITDWKINMLIHLVKTRFILTKVKNSCNA